MRDLRSVDLQCELLDVEGHVAGGGVQRLAAKGHITHIRARRWPAVDAGEARDQRHQVAGERGLVALGDPGEDLLALGVGGMIEVALIEG